MKNEQLQKKLGAWALVCGVLSIIFYVLHDVIGAMHYPGYEWTKQAVSDLTALDAPSFAVARGYSSVYGIFNCVCCAFLCTMVGGERRSLKLGVWLFAAM